MNNGGPSCLGLGRNICVGDEAFMAQLNNLNNNNNHNHSSLCFVANIVKLLREDAKSGNREVKNYIRSLYERANNGNSNNNNIQLGKSGISPNSTASDVKFPTVNTKQSPNQSDYQWIL